MICQPEYMNNAPLPIVQLATPLYLSSHLSYSDQVVMLAVIVRCRISPGCVFSLSGLYLKMVSCGCVIQKQKL